MFTLYYIKEGFLTPEKSSKNNDFYNFWIPTRTQSPLRQSSNNCQDSPKGHRTTRNSQDVETADNMSKIFD